MTLQETLHREHIDRLRRFTPKSKPKPVLVMVAPLPRPRLVIVPPVLSECDRWEQAERICLRKFPIPGMAGANLMIREIQVAVADYYKCTVLDMVSDRRTADVVRPRHVAMYLCRLMTLHGLPAIGRHFGGRDHTTVLHAFRKIQGLVASDPLLNEEVLSIEIQLSVGRSG